MSRYEDILHQYRPPSHYPKMKRQERAKIFSPFAALNGYDAVVHAQDRVLVPRIVLTDDTKEQLNETLMRLKKGDLITVVFFIQERWANGERMGEYITMTETVQKVDAVKQVLSLDSREVPFADIYRLSVPKEE